MENKQNFWLLIMLANLFSTISVGQLPNILPKNEFGLLIIHTKAAYQQTILNDSFKKMVAVKDIISPLNTNFIYATTNNFTHTILYKNPQVYLRLAAVKALQHVCNDLKKQGLAIKIFDAYRPYRVTKKMWQIVPDDRYAANPAKGSGHNRGIAVDITLINDKTGNELAMPTAFDDFTEKAHHNYMQLDSVVIYNRQLLKTVMQKNGFIALDTEWWHYYLPNSAKYELLDFNFKQMNKLVK
ncbi:MAG: M15 family metallopeptidase [Deinococcales bacterium]|nr:M15 family metallopeptidase [Chitinophagaceae bacterium]